MLSDEALEDFGVAGPLLTPQVDFLRRSDTGSLGSHNRRSVYFLDRFVVVIACVP
jgi:hypothetical protein